MELQVICNTILSVILLFSIILILISLNCFKDDDNKHKYSDLENKNEYKNNK